MLFILLFTIPTSVSMPSNIKSCFLASSFFDDRPSSFRLSCALMRLNVFGEMSPETKAAIGSRPGGMSGSGMSMPVVAMPDKEARQPANACLDPERVLPPPFRSGNIQDKQHLI